MNANPHAHDDERLAALSAPNLRLRVGEHVVDMGTLRVVSHPDKLRLTGKAADVLIELARNSGNTVSREHLLDTVWKGRVTTPDVVTQAIKELRRAFADNARPASYIETVPRKGYRLVAPTVPLATAAPAPIPATDLPEPVAYIRASEEPPTPGLENTDPGRRRRRAFYARPTVLLVAIGLVAIALSTLAHRWLQPARKSSAAAEAQWRSVNLRSLTSAPGAEFRPSISPDGTRAAYTIHDKGSGFDRIVLRSTGRQSRQMWLTTRVFGNEEMSAWSPDGTQIAFERLGKHEKCTLYVAPSMGGADREIGPCGNFIVNYFDWTPDGKGLITSSHLHRNGRPDSGLALTILDIATGQSTPLQYQRSASNQDVQAFYSPDGRLIVFRRGLSPHSDLFLTSAAGGKVRQLTHLSARIIGYTWTPDSRNVILSTNPNGVNELFIVNIANGKLRALGVSPATYPDAASHGDVVVYQIPRTKYQLAEISPQGKLQTPTRLARSTGNDSAPSFSGDGRHVAFVSDRGGDQQLWICSSDGRNALPLTDLRDAVIWNPVWSPDDSRILISVRRNGAVQLLEVEVASHRVRAVAASETGLLAGSYGPQPDSYLAIRQKHDADGELILITHADRPEQTVSVIAENVNDFQHDPGSDFVYYAKSDARGIYRFRLSGGEKQFVTRHIDTIVTGSWRVVGGRLWYVTGMLMNPFEIRSLDPSSGKEKIVARVHGELLNVNFSVSPTHDRILVTPMGPIDVDIGAFKLVRTSKPR